MRNNQYRAKEIGFSLLELILVVTLIGILSALALKKYIEVRHSANIAVLQGTKLSLQGAASFTFSKSLLAGSDRQRSGAVSINAKHPFKGKSDSRDLFIVATRYGYPQGSWTELIKVLDFGQGKWSYSNQLSGEIKQVVFWITGGPGSMEHCHIRYQSALEYGYRPKMTINKTGC